MTQLNSKSIQTILQEALDKDKDFLKELTRRILQPDGRRKRSTGRRWFLSEKQYY